MFFFAATHEIRSSLKTVSDTGDCQIHGFCFLTNHFCPVMQTGEKPLARIMQSIALRYMKWLIFTRSSTRYLSQAPHKAVLPDVIGPA